VAALPEEGRELGANETGAANHDDFQVFVLSGGCVFHSVVMMPEIRFSV
jgi:hypothetical protein